VQPNTSRGPGKGACGSTQDVCLSGGDALAGWMSVKNGSSPAFRRSQGGVRVDPRRRQPELERLTRRLHSESGIIIARTATSRALTSTPTKNPWPG